jgi:hypothetical protein
VNTAPPLTPVAHVPIAWRLPLPAIWMCSKLTEPPTGA